MTRCIDTADLADLAGVTPREARRSAARGHLGAAYGFHPIKAQVRPGRGRAGRRLAIVIDSLPQNLRERVPAPFPELAPQEPSAFPVPVEKVRKPRNDRGKARVVVGRKADRALGAGGLDAGALRAFGDFAQNAFLSVWAQGVTGSPMVLDAVRPDLESKARELGYRRTDAELEAIVAGIPRHLVERTRAKGKVLHRRRRDAKRDNNAAPHVHRDWNQAPPGAVAILDGSIGDTLYRRDDGSEGTAKLVGVIDGGSGHITVYPVFCPKGRGVGMSETALGFALMCLDRGTVPGWIVTDRGTEYGWTDLPLLEDLLRAAWPDEALGLDLSCRPPRRVSRSLPYRAASKGGVEAMFRIVKDVGRDLPGFLDGDRMRKPTQALGRATKAVLTADELGAALEERVAYINARPMERHGGRSRAEVFAQRPRHDIDFLDVQVAFAREKAVAVRQGGFRLGGVRYVADALCSRPWLDRALVYVPIFGDRRYIAVHDPQERGQPFLCHATPEMQRHPLDPAGAKESSRRRRLHAQGIAEIAARSIPIDISENLRIVTARRRAAIGEGAKPVAVPVRLTLNGAFGAAADDRRRIAAAGETAAPALPEPEPDYFDLMEAKRKASS